MNDDLLSTPAGRNCHTFASLNMSAKECQSSNEKTPKSKFILSHATPNLSNNNSTDHNNSSKTARLKLSMNSPSFTSTQFSTPKNCTPISKHRRDYNNSVYNEAEFSVTNPFENQSIVDSLLHPSSSPSVFASTSNQTCNESVQQSPGSFWNIDQIAIMKPADIDLSKLHEQQNFVKFDPATELKAQKAIDSFFANGINITSPWSSSEKPHYLAIISPAVPTSSARSNKMCRRRDAVGTPNLVKTDSPLFEKVAEHCKTENAATVSTQTTLSIPFDVDLGDILGKYFTYKNEAKDFAESQTNEVLSNSSLRRKLFFQDIEENDELDDSCFEGNPNKDDQKLSQEIDAFPMSGDSQPDADFHAEHMKTPSLKSKCSVPKTPSTCQSPFSSSPVAGGRMFDLGTPCRSRAQDRNAMETMSPCLAYSPIRMDRKVADKKEKLARDSAKGCEHFMPDVQPFPSPGLCWNKVTNNIGVLTRDTEPMNDDLISGHISPQLSPIAEVKKQNAT